MSCANRAEQGSMSIELVLLTVPLVVILLFVAALGRFSSARNQVDEAARDAAREASLHSSTITARTEAVRIADDDLSGVACGDRTVDVDTTALRPGGAVTVRVTCRVPLGDLVLLKVPGSRVVTSTSTSVVDTYAEP